MYRRRAISDSLQAASEQFPVVLLTGPRQVGNTTPLLNLAGKQRRYVTLDDPLARELAQSDPALFLQRYEPPVLIDEIQYAPQLLPLIKMAVDGKRKRGRLRRDRDVLTGPCVMLGDKWAAAVGNGRPTRLESIEAKPGGGIREQKNVASSAIQALTDANACIPGAVTWTRSLLVRCGIARRTQSAETL